MNQDDYVNLEDKHIQTAFNRQSRKETRKPNYERRSSLGIQMNYSLQFGQQNTSTVNNDAEVHSELDKNDQNTYVENLVDQSPTNNASLDMSQ